MNRFIGELVTALGPDAVLSQPEDLYTYESDALTTFRVRPGAVVLPSSTADVQAVVRPSARAGTFLVAHASLKDYH
jgi:glycolate oxidase